MSEKLNNVPLIASLPKGWRVSIETDEEDPKTVEVIDAHTPLCVKLEPPEDRNSWIE